MAPQATASRQGLRWERCCPRCPGSPRRAVPRGRPRRDRDRSRNDLGQGARGRGDGVAGPGLVDGAPAERGDPDDRRLVEAPGAHELGPGGPGPDRDRQGDGMDRGHGVVEGVLDGHHRLLGTRDRKGCARARRCRQDELAGRAGDHVERDRGGTCQTG